MIWKDSRQAVRTLDRCPQLYVDFRIAITIMVKTNLRKQRCTKSSYDPMNSAS